MSDTTDLFIEHQESLRGELLRNAEGEIILDGFADYVVAQLVSCRNKITDAEVLAGLVRAYITRSGMRPTTPPQAIQHIKEK